MPTFRQKALGYYRDQDIRIIAADCVAGSIQPYAIGALVRGYEQTYRVTLANGTWSCDCDQSLTDCAHRAAVQMCTGHRSSAAKEMAQ